MYSKLAWRNIWRNKRRTWITISAIGFAVFFATVLKSTQIGSYDRMIDNVARFFTGYAQVHASGYWEEKSLDYTFEHNESDLKTIENMEGVSLATPRLESFALASFGIQTKGTMVMGIDIEKEDQLTQIRSKLVEGSYLNADDEGILIAKGLAEFLKVSVGDTLVLISSGYHGANAAGKYAVKGILKFPVPDQNNGVIYMTLASAQYLYAAENRLTSYALLVNNDQDTENIVASLKSGLNSDNYEVMSWREMLPEIIQQIELDYVSGWIMRLVLYIIIGFGIFGTFLMMVNERRYEFGIMMAIGMKRLKLQIIVFMETILISIVGILTGTLFSLPMLIYFYLNPIYFTGDYAEMMESYGMEPILPFSLDSSVFTGQAVLVLILTMLLAIYPLFAIQKLKINSAMRS